MTKLNVLDFAKKRIQHHFQFILTELLSELYDDPLRESLEFPSQETLDLLGLHDGYNRKRVETMLKEYGYGVQAIWGEYSLTSLMTLKPYLRCSTVCAGDIVLGALPGQITRNTHELSV